MILPECFEHDTPDGTSCNLQMERAILDIAAGRLPCDAWHHFYHYQSSAQYLWLAETLRALGKVQYARVAYERAIFQDHFNEEALEGKKLVYWDWVEGQKATMPKYNKHPFFDLEFRGLIGAPPDDATKLHDEGARALLAGDIVLAFFHLDKAIAANPLHSNSHFTRGKCHFFERRFDTAYADFTEAIRLSHMAHDAYHRSASNEHLERGRGFFRQGKLDLAINDFTKALDLHRKNKEALATRAQAYRAKGSVKLAEEDEAMLASW